MSASRPPQSPRSPRSKDSSIPSALTYSLFLHVLLIAAALFIAQRSMTFRPPAPYIVSLVESSLPQGPEGGAEEARKAPEVKAEKDPSPPPMAVPKETTKETPKESKKEADNRIAERIDALKAKKRLEQLVSLRKVVDIASVPKSSPASSQKSAVTGSGGAVQGAGGSDYLSIIMKKIKEQWIYTETFDSDLQAVVLIRIARDGGVTIEKMEKSSGNPLYDRSALRAITKASPLPPPPQEMELGVRF